MSNATPVILVGSGNTPIGSSTPVLTGSKKKQVIEASQTDVSIGGGANGVYIAGILLTPLTTAPGAIDIKDGSGSSYERIFVGGVGSVLDLTPRAIPYPALGEEAGGWFISTGANMRVTVFGNWP